MSTVLYITIIKIYSASGYEKHVNKCKRREEVTPSPVTNINIGLFHACINVGTHCVANEL